MSIKNEPVNTPEKATAGPLSADQIEAFNQDGYLLLENALNPEQLAALTKQFEAWVALSREYTEPFGTTLDGRPRFDVEPGHTKENPALRRIASPIEISDDYLAVMRNNSAIDALTQLYSLNLKFHHCKINSKLPGAATKVKYHQDFPFEPHSNDNLATVLFFLDEVTLQNGPLEVVPGSHRGQLHSLWHDGVFTGAIAEEAELQARAKAIACAGKAGSACIMHTRLLHGSAPNLSDQPRTLFIACYSAEDAYPLSPNPLPTNYAGEIVAGKLTNRVRAVNYEMELPEVPTGASFFSQQESVEAN